MSLHFTIYKLLPTNKMAFVRSSGLIALHFEKEREGRDNQEKRQEMRWYLKRKADWLDTRKLCITFTFVLTMSI